MNKLEYRFTFMSVVLAPGLTDILVSLHRMLKIRREIR